MALRTIYLIRHGQYTPTMPAIAEPDGPLTPRGQEQAALTARRLRGFPIGRIHHSTLRRASETASIIAAQFPNVPVLASPLLRECIPSVPASFATFFEVFPGDLIAAGGPQAQEVFDTYFKPAGATDQHELIVSSGNLISYLICRVLGAPADAWFHIDVQHCGMSEITIGPPRQILLVRHNDVGHLPRHLQTYT